MSKNHEIVILGTNFAGLAVTHYLLKHTIPALAGTTAIHITLVGPNDKYFFKIAAPRVAVDPSKISISQVGIPLKDGLGTYPADKLTIEQGLATGVDETAKTVTVTAADKTTKTLTYNSLVIGTGTASDALWTIQDSGFDATHDAFVAMHAALPKAKTVVVAGGGPVGVETAGEILTKYPNIKLTILSGTDRLLPNLSQNTSKKAANMLKSKGAEVVHAKKAVEPKRSSAEPVIVKFDNGTSQQADVYISATGGAPNSGFLPKSWLDERNKVKVDGTQRTPVAGVYALGDVASNSASTLIDFYSQWPAAVSAIGQDIAIALEQTKPKTGPFKDRKFKEMKDTQFVPIGPSGGVAQVFGWGLPSFVVWLVKSRAFFIEKARPAVVGDDYVKA